MTAYEENLQRLGAALCRASNGRANVSRLDDNTRIIEDIGLSSLDLLELRAEVEEQWQMKVADDDLVQIRTVGDIVALIDGRTCT